jgi:hypothetical protein
MEFPNRRLSRKFIATSPANAEDFSLVANGPHARRIMRPPFEPAPSKDEDAQLDWQQSGKPDKKLPASKGNLMTER